MEKLSSILPSSARVKSVDLDEAPPARPGAPAMGRKQGSNSIADRISLSKQAKEMAAQDTMMVKNPREASRAKMVEEINRKFFETRLKPVEKEMSTSEAVTGKLYETEDVAPIYEDVLSASETESPVVAPRRLSIEA